MKFVWLGIALVFVGSMIVVVKIGFAPRPQTQIKPSVFNHLEEVGAAVYRRLYGEMKNYKSVRVEGLGGPGLEGISQGIWKTGKFYGQDLRLELVNLSQSNSKNYFRSKGLKQATSEQLQILVYPFAISPTGAKELTDNCHRPRSEALFEGDLNCLAAEVSRRFLKKKLPEDRIVALMEKYGRQKSIVFIHMP